MGFLILEFKSQQIRVHIREGQKARSQSLGSKIKAIDSIW